MSMISNLVDSLRHYQNVPEIGYSEVFGINEICKDAADTIEELSAKLQSADMERSEAYYDGEWISCEDRLPDGDNVKVIVSAIWDGYKYTTESYFYHGRFYNKPYYQISAGQIQESYTGDKVFAWQPLPQPYHIMKTKNSSSNKNKM